MQKSILFFSVLFTWTTHQASAQHLVIGTYTDKGNSKGLYIYSFNATNGTTKQLNLAATSNPSFLTVNKKNTFVYSVNENDIGTLAAFQYNKKNNTLSLVNSQTNQGSAPCYIGLDRTGKWLFSGNYGNGSIVVHPILTDGSIGNIHQYIQHKGSSSNKDRQAAPHVHCTYISPNNKYLYVPDLGIDQVVVYPFDAATGYLDTLHKTHIATKSGSGPRHIVFTKNGRYGYLVEEMSGKVQVIKYERNRHTIMQTENHLPQGQEGAGGDIHLSPDEKFLYVSQRSNSTIQIFKANRKNGKITFIGHQPTLGNFPRNFTIHPSGKYLLAANQRSNNVTIFKRNLLTGLLTDTGIKIKIDSPVCLQWIQEK